MHRDPSWNNTRIGAWTVFWIGMKNDDLRHRYLESQKLMPLEHNVSESFAVRIVEFEELVAFSATARD